MPAITASKCLCGADVRRGLVARICCSRVCRAMRKARLATTVLAHTDDAAGDQAFSSRRCRRRSCVRSTVAHRNAEIAGCCPRTHRRPIHRRAQSKVSASRSLHTATFHRGGFRFRHQPRAGRSQLPSIGRVLHDHAEERRHRASKQFTSPSTVRCPLGSRASFSTRCSCGKKALVDEELVVALWPCGPARDRTSASPPRRPWPHPARSVRDGQRGEVAHHRLKVQQASRRPCEISAW
jgi:hypothetical protein